MGKSEKSHKPETDLEKKRLKKKLDKAVMAKRKLSRMKKLGFLSAPPRRSAALNASAIMNCMLETGAAVKIKVERGSVEDERITDQITNNTVLGDSQIVDKYSETGQQLEQGCKAASHEKPSAKQKPKTVASIQKRKEASDIVIKKEEEELEEEEVEQDKNNEEEDSDMDREREKLKV